MLEHFGKSRRDPAKTNLVRAAKTCCKHSVKHGTSMARAHALSFASISGRIPAAANALRGILLLLIRP
jgi:hypothetical protein